MIFLPQHFHPSGESLRPAKILPTTCSKVQFSPLLFLKKSNPPSAFYLFPHNYLKVYTLPLSLGDVVVIMVNEDGEAEEDMGTH